MARPWKRLAAGVFTLALLAGACGGDDDDGGDTTAGEDTETTAGGTGEPPENTAGFDGKTIKLGVISPLTGPVAAIGVPLTAGNEVFKEYVNKELGGIAGKYQIELVTEDSQYSPQVAVQAYNKIKGDVVMFAQLLGTPVTKAVLPQLATDGIVAAPASLDAEWVRDPNLLPIGGPYQIQMINAADYLVSEGGAKDKVFCSQIQDDAYGEAGQQGIDFAAEKLDFEVKTTSKHKGAAADFTANVQQLKDAGCEVVFLVSTPTDTGKLLGTAAQLKFAPQWVGQSPSYIGALSASPLKDYLAQTFLLISEGTEWGDESVPGMKTMIERIGKYKPDQQPDYYFGFGYNQMNAVVQVLEKAVELGDLSHEGIKKAMEEVGTLTFDGLTGDYEYGTAEDRNPPRTSTLFKINPTKPIGLEVVKAGFESDHAAEFEFEAAG